MRVRETERERERERERVGRRAVEGLERGVPKCEERTRIEERSGVENKIEMGHQQRRRPRPTFELGCHRIMATISFYTAAVLVTCVNKGRTCTLKNLLFLVGVVQCVTLDGV